MSETICFIGGGNMATSLIGGLIANGHPAERIIACDPNAEQRERLAAEFDVQTSGDNLASVGAADAVVLAVKPQIMQLVCEPLAEALEHHKPVIISVAAGIRCADIDRWLGGEQILVRCMPNTPALYGKGASGLFATADVSDAQRALATRVTGAAGIVEWVAEERLLDAVTALSGSGPAYGFLLLEAMENAAVELGLDAPVARRLAIQTLLGAATMAEQDPRDPAALRQAVTSKGGTTAAALAVFEQAGMRSLVADAMRAANDRAESMANEAGDS